MTGYDMDIIKQEVAKALAISDLLTSVGNDVIANSVVGAGMVFTEILVGIQARLED